MQQSGVPLLVHWLVLSLDVLLQFVDGCAATRGDIVRARPEHGLAIKPRYIVLKLFPDHPAYRRFQSTSDSRYGLFGVEVYQ